MKTVKFQELKRISHGNDNSYVFGYLVIDYIDDLLFYINNNDDWFFEIFETN